MVMSYWMYFISCIVDKDVLRTDRELPLFNDAESPKLVQLEDILKTYTMYNFDLGMLRVQYIV